MEQEPTPEEEPRLVVPCSQCEEWFEITKDNSIVQLYARENYAHLSFLVIMHDCEDSEEMYKFIDLEHVPYLEAQSNIYVSDTPTPDMIEKLQKAYENNQEGPDDDIEVDGVIDVESRLVDPEAILYELLYTYDLHAYELSKRWLYKPQ